MRRSQENLITIITIMADKLRSGKRQARWFMICGLRALQYRSGISGKRGEGEHSINMSSDPGVVTVQPSKSEH